MEMITSKENQKIKYIRKLISSSSFRHEERRFVAEGVRLCEDALRSRAEVVLALFSEDFSLNHRDQFERLSAACRESYLVRNSIFCGLSDTKTPQGVLFVIKTLDKPIDFDKMNKNGKVLALESVCDPSNLGTVLRSAEAFSVDLVVMSDDCCDLYSPKVIRGSMGAIFRQKVMITSDLPGFIRSFNRHGSSYAAVLRRDSLPLGQTPLSSPCLCAVGNEGRGLSEKLISVCTQTIYIPMSGEAESLNAAVAASILMWEMTK